MPGFNISPEEIIDMGNKMKSDAETMLNDLKTITTTMNRVPDNYQGAASDEISQKYNSLSPHFEEFKDAVVACADFLISNANKIKETEEAARRAASQNI